jgi:hypothetical protein
MPLFWRMRTTTRRFSAWPSAVVKSGDGWLFWMKRLGGVVALEVLVKSVKAGEGE